MSKTKNTTPCFLPNDFLLLSAVVERICKTFFLENGYPVFCLNITHLDDGFRAAFLAHLRALIQNNGAKPLFLTINGTEVAYIMEEKDGHAFVFTRLYPAESSGSVARKSSDVSAGVRPDRTKVDRMPPKKVRLMRNRHPTKKKKAGK